MAKFIAGCVLGSLLTYLAVGIFSRTERQLIDDWRLVQPGMTRSEVIQLFGEPESEMDTGPAGFPAWAEKSVPENYSDNHALLIFLVPGPGPELLLVYLDGDDRVSFVSSTPT